MPEQFADEQAIAAAKHEQVNRPCEPRPRREQGWMGEPIVVNRLVVGVELKVAAKVEPEPSRASLKDQRSVRGHLSHPSALGLLGRVGGDEEWSPIEDGRRAGGRVGVMPRSSTTRPPGVQERRRVEEQAEEQDHRKDPGFARPITFLTTSSSRVGVLCEYFARFSFSRLGGGGLEDGGGHVGRGANGSQLPPRAGGAGYLHGDQPRADPDVPALPVLVLHVLRELGGVLPVVDVADLRRLERGRRRRASRPGPGGNSRGGQLTRPAREVVGRSPLVPRSDAWDLAPLAASSRGGLASCGGMRREPDVRQEFPASGPSQVLPER
jgi:hypothetical protein